MQENSMVISKPFISFSNDFKKQYYSRNKSDQDKIKNTLNELQNLMVYIIKKEIKYKKIKFDLNITSTDEILRVIISNKSTKPRIIIKQIGR